MILQWGTNSKEFGIYSIVVNVSTNADTYDILENSTWEWEYVSNKTNAPDISLIGLIEKDSSEETVADLKDLAMSRPEITLTDDLLGTITFVVTNISFNRRTDSYNTLRYQIRGKVINWA